MMTQRRSILRNPTEGHTIAVVGDVYRFLATSDDTHGTYSTWEAIVPPGGGPPPHVHSREEEGFYILEGEITLQAGEQRLWPRYVREHANRHATLSLVIGQTRNRHGKRHTLKRFSGTCFNREVWTYIQANRRVDQTPILIMDV